MESVIQFTPSQLLLCAWLYGVAAWTVQVLGTALLESRYVNRGLLNLPLNVPAAIAAGLLAVALPTLGNQTGLQFALCLVVLWVVRGLSRQFVRGISRMEGLTGPEEQNILLRLGLDVLLALGCLWIYLVGHPFVYALVVSMPRWLVMLLDGIAAALLLADFAAVAHTLRTRQMSPGAKRRDSMTRRMAERLSRRLWARLEKAYPGVERMEEENRSRYTFGSGLCFDKLVWVFLISSFLGALIEMVYCYALGHVWMNRSSVLYGSFSFVWGFGAVVLTVVLHRFAGKEDRKIFLAGFLVGGAYEYLCSVFTELFFGTVFWDYSEMPLNIGGRTNVLYCIFWGLLAVVWIKVLYPPMERGIERIPPVIGKVITWVIVAAMVCNGLLTAGAMVRYSQRQEAAPPVGVIGDYLDAVYPDGWMEHRWPNMKLTEPGEA